MSVRELRRIVKSCGPIGGLAYLSWLLGNRAYYSQRPLKRALGLALYALLDVLVIRVLASAHLPAQARIGARLRLPHGGNGVVLHPRVVIGDDVKIFHQVTIGALTDDNTKAPIIGNGVLIGAGAKVLGGITVGDQARVGANAVVLQNVPPRATAVGNPARIIEAQAGFQSPVVRSTRMS